MLTRPPYLQAVIMPAIQSWIGGGLAYLTLDSLAIWRGSENPRLAAFCGGMVACTITWTVFVYRWQRILERCLLRDKLTDNKPTVITMVSEDKRQGEYIHLPASREQLKRLGNGLTSGQSFSVNAWAGRDGVFTVKEFETLRATLIKRGIMEWKTPGAPQQGVRLTRPGEHVMRYLAKE